MRRIHHPTHRLSRVVLADANFATIVAAVEEGRAILANIRKFLRYLLSSNLGEVMTMFFGVLLADVIGLAPSSDSLVLSPLLATQILWINLVTDGAPALALGLDPPDAGMMTQPPRPRREEVITRTMWGGIVFVGAVMAQARYWCSMPAHRRASSKGRARSPMPSPWPLLP
jgi:P-type Ca2+ transporter type 2C